MAPLSERLDERINRRRATLFAGSMNATDGGSGTSGNAPWSGLRVTTGVVSATAKSDTSQAGSTATTPRHLPMLTNHGDGARSPDSTHGVHVSGVALVPIAKVVDGNTLTESEGGAGSAPFPATSAGQSREALVQSRPLLWISVVGS